MSRIQLVISLMVIVAVIIIGIAAYVFTHLSGINLTQGVVLIAVAVTGLLLILGVIIIILRSATAKK
jgi:nitrate reductase gamma subunit